MKGKGKFFVDHVQMLRTDGGQGEGGDGQNKGGGLGASIKSKRPLSKDPTEGEEAEKMPGQKKSRQLLMEAGEEGAKEAENTARLAVEQERYTRKREMQELMFQTEISRQELDREEEDNRIMSMDLTGMPLGKAQFFERKCAAIVARQEAKDAKELSDRHAAELAAEQARQAAVAEANRAAAYAVSLEGIAALAAAAASAAAAVEATDKAERVRAALLVKADLAKAAQAARTGQNKEAVVDLDPAEPMSSLCDSEGEEEEDDSLHDALCLAASLEEWAKTLGEDTGPVDVYDYSEMAEFVAGTQDPDTQTESRTECHTP